MKKLFIVLFLLLTSFLYAQNDILPLKDVKPGMKGVGLTVFENNEIESFKVEVLMFYIIILLTEISFLSN